MIIKSSSLVGRRLFLLTNSISRTHVQSAIGRQQQTCAAVNSPSEVQNDAVPVFKHAVQFGDKIALRDVHGDYTYRGLFLSSRQFSNELSKILDGSQQERVVFLMPNDASYVIAQWACWMSGQIAVPLSVSHPAPLLDYFIKDADAKVVVTTLKDLPLVEPIVTSNRHLIVFDDVLRMLAMKTNEKEINNRYTFQHDYGNSLDAGVKGDFYNNSDAMFIYTSGTTGKPKGVVLSHKNLHSQVNTLINAWNWTEKDVILHTLPLNHIHGIVNVLLCPLYVGARCVMLPKFEVSSVWSNLLGINVNNLERVNIFMAVPTIYTKLIQEYDQLFSKKDKMVGYVHTICSNKMRLMVSGSAPLPKPVFERWEEITGHRLLERYGMTETGMVLSNPLQGQRIPGTVGTPLPGVEVRITKSNATDPDSAVLVHGTYKGSRVLTKSTDQISGDLQVKGNSVFQRYWNKPEATAKAFTNDGWLKTGDIAAYKDGMYKILGRSSIDIIKTGGYKVSALQVETEILGHPDIKDCAVVGLADVTWGEKVAAVVVLKEGSQITLSELREFAKKSLPEYAVPTVLKVIQEIPRNHMGKVNKADILKTVFSGNKE